MKLDAVVPVLEYPQLQLEMQAIAYQVKGQEEFSVRTACFSHCIAALLVRSWKGSFTASNVEQLQAGLCRRRLTAFRCMFHAGVWVWVLMIEAKVMQGVFPASLLFPWPIFGRPFGLWLRTVCSVGWWQHVRTC